MNKEILAESTSWRDDGEALLAETKLEFILTKYGEVIETGSFVYDLMLDGDIDIYVVTTSPSKKLATTILTDLIDNSSLNGYMLFDWVNFRRDYFQVGYYVGAKTDYRDRRWNIDIWLVNEFPASHKDYNDWLIANLNPENREIILEIKKARRDNKWDADGKTIYDAVIIDGVKTVEEFANGHIKNQNK